MSSLLVCMIDNSCFCFVAKTCSNIGIGADKRNDVIHHAEGVIKKAQDTLNTLAKPNQTEEGYRLKDYVHKIQDTIKKLKTDRHKAVTKYDIDQVKSYERAILREIHIVTTPLRELLLEEAAVVLKNLDDHVVAFKIKSMATKEELATIEEIKVKLTALIESLKKETDLAKVKEYKPKIDNISMTLWQHYSDIYRSHNGHRSTVGHLSKTTTASSQQHTLTKM